MAKIHWYGIYKKEDTNSKWVAISKIVNQMFLQKRSQASQLLQIII